MNIQRPDSRLFYEYYKKPGPAPRLFFAPGRVNLIGEHTDYNNGYVFPCALNFGTYLWIRNISEPVIRLASTNFDFRAEIPIQDLSLRIRDEWVNYPLGIIPSWVILSFWHTIILHYIFMRWGEHLHFLICSVNLVLILLILLFYLHDLLY